ncbi:hypothetical protein [Hafnia alvei]|uniref:Secretion system chaperone SseA n=1 Tax=Hafnia alvei TaxID=569 RepID=A0A1C6YV02_HAFAL|nr:hypothetical protein [Hafnia alvei]NLS55310.1 hypothetical protein [Hafnia alvei]SCM50664.1 secretion system chaperone SseA [Hafnia alvei]
MKINIEAEKKRIERECLRLDKFFSDFTFIKSAMAELVANAETDPQAREKLRQLEALFPEGIQGMEQNARRDMKTLSVALKKVQSQLSYAISNSDK